MKLRTVFVMSVMLFASLGYGQAWNAFFQSASNETGEIYLLTKNCDTIVWEGTPWESQVLNGIPDGVTVQIWNDIAPAGPGPEDTPPIDLSFTSWITGGTGLDGLLMSPDNFHAGGLMFVANPTFYLTCSYEENTGNRVSRTRYTSSTITALNGTGEIQYLEFMQWTCETTTEFAHDFACINITSPASPPPYLPGTELEITARFVNMGFATEASPIKYRLTESAIIEEFTQVVPCCQEELHTFATHLILPPANGTYQLLVWTDLPTDLRRANDTCRISLVVSDSAQTINPTTEPLVPAYALHQNYPNPFNPATEITYDMKEAGRITITIFNTLGQKARTLVNDDVSAGRHSVPFNGSGLPSGMYICRMETREFQTMNKMLLLK